MSRFFAGVPRATECPASPWEASRTTRFRSVILTAESQRRFRSPCLSFFFFLPFPRPVAPFRITGARGHLVLFQADRQKIRPELRFVTEERYPVDRRTVRTRRIVRDRVTAQSAETCRMCVGASAQTWHRDSLNHLHFDLALPGFTSR